MPCGSINETVYGCSGCHRLIPDCAEGTEGCCHCLPRFLVVTFRVTDPAGGSCSGCECSRYHTRLELSCAGGSPVYAGNIVCGSMTIDVAFSIVKNDDGQCLLCLTSTELGLACTTAASYSGGKRMADPSTSGDCEHEPSTDRPNCCCLQATWSDLDLSAVTGAGECLAADITTAAAPYKSANWGDCSDCWDCNCVNCEICICLIRYDASADRCEECRQCEPLVFDPDIGTLGGWGPVTLECGDLTTTVQLELTPECGVSVAATGFATTEQILVCPDIALSVVLDDDPSDTIELHINSRQAGEDCDAADPPAECEGCCAAMSDIHCEEPEFTITVSSNDCSALNATATLTQQGPGECVVYDSTANADFCDPETDPACDACALAGWSAELDCDPDCNSEEPCRGAFLSFSWDNACCDELAGSTLGTLWPTACSCEPFSLTFEIPSFENVCCSCESATACSDVVITVTEA